MVRVPDSLERPWSNNMTPGGPVMIVGAGRSGTNLLARVLGQDPRFWNSFENRYIWNYGARTLAHDVRTRIEATPGVCQYIRSFFQRTAARRGQIVVDKTPRNVFRIPFVHAVMPEARIIHIIRDGRANLLSRQIQWYGGNQVYEATKSRAVTRRTALLVARFRHMQALLARGNIPPGRSRYSWLTMRRRS